MKINLDTNLDNQNQTETQDFQSGQNFKLQQFEQNIQYQPEQYKNLIQDQQDYYQEPQVSKYDQEVQDTTISELYKALNQQRDEIMNSQVRINNLMKAKNVMNNKNARLFSVQQEHNDEFHSQINEIALLKMLEIKFQNGSSVQGKINNDQDDVDFSEESQNKSGHFFTKYGGKIKEVKEKDYLDQLFIYVQILKKGYKNYLEQIKLKRTRFV
ncbi:hypothetical protein OXYTRIMIC_359 [Oxytricha trifallax]|uniref:Uncharacterized protein n=1 Tax=Oxytricha trifallax TaxID=1172189 RepID=A0A073HXS1_9SPIT|nr:hypothetical protein OXYTRIMIC_359 [Oxytricha trifallax]